MSQKSLYSKKIIIVPLTFTSDDDLVVSVESFFKVHPNQKGRSPLNNTSTHYPH